MPHARRSTLALVAAAALSWGIALAQGVTDLLTMSPTWEALYNAADVDGLTGLYTEDAVIMPPEAPATSGVAAMRAQVEAYLGFGLVRAEVPAVVAYGIFGDDAWGAGPYRFYDANGNLVAEGKYVVLYRRVDGAWRIVRHIWNNDHPAPGAGG